MKQIWHHTIYSLFVFIFASSASFAASLKSQEIKMDDGHSLVLHSKSADNPRGSILLIHGRTWSALPDFDLVTPTEDLSMMNALVSEGLVVYALDLRGYGKSGRDASGWNTPNRSAKDVANTLDFINLLHQKRNLHNVTQTSLFGWSNGSLVAMLTAQQYPEKVQSLILYGFPRDTEQKIPEQITSANPPRVLTTKLAAAEDFIVPGSISESAIAAFVEAATSADPIRMDWNMLHQWNQLDPSQVKVSTLLLQAEFDPLANVNADAELFKRLATHDKQWIILANADHAALLESSRFKFYHSIISFMQWVII